MFISDRIKEKLKEKHGVSSDVLFECFYNREKEFLIDTREDHKTDPPTKWFISETDVGLKLKICFIERDGIIHIKTAYAPNQKETRIYQKFA